MVTSLVVGALRLDPSAPTIPMPHPNVIIATSFLGARVPAPGRGVGAQLDLDRLGS